MEFTEAESNMNDLVSEYQQYQEATIEVCFHFSLAVCNTFLLPFSFILDIYLDVFNCLLPFMLFTFILFYRMTNFWKKKKEKPKWLKKFKHYVLPWIIPTHFYNSQNYTLLKKLYTIAPFAPILYINCHLILMFFLHIFNFYITKTWTSALLKNINKTKDKFIFI